MLVAIATSSGASAGEEPASDNGVEVGVAQCGFHVTALALAAFKRECDAVQLSHHLRPTSSGISLDQITEVLNAFCINVQVRSEVSWSMLQEELPRNPGNGIHVVRVPFLWERKNFREQVTIPVTAMPGDANARVVIGQEWCVCEISHHRDAILVGLKLTIDSLISIRSGETLCARIQLAGAALYQTFEIHVTQDFSQIRFKNRIFTVAESEIEISGSLEMDFDQDWRAKVLPSSEGVAEISSSWRRIADDGWVLSVQLHEPIQRPSPIRIQFYHPSFLPIERSVVFLPASK